jgi:hypothetical protein
MWAVLRPATTSQSLSRNERGTLGIDQMSRPRYGVLNSQLEARGDISKVEEVQWENSSDGAMDMHLASCRVGTRGVSEIQPRASGSIEIETEVTEPQVESLVFRPLHGPRLEVFKYFKP